MQTYHMAKTTVQRIDYSEAEQMLRAGSTQQEVAEKFGVGQSAIAAAIGRGRIKIDTGFKKRLPWKVRREHHSLAIPRALRLAMRVQENDPDLSPQLRKIGEGFIKTLEDLDAVIHYEPELENPFLRVPRRPGIDNGLVREPD